MKFAIVAVAVLAAMALGGCKRKADGSMEIVGAQHQKGRYQGVGIYSPESSWAHLTDIQQPNGPSKTAADQAIIVTVDSDTGEMRACGDLSGYCIGMNPWDKDLVSAQKTPVAVTPAVIDDKAPDATPTSAKPKTK